MTINVKEFLNKKSMKTIVDERESYDKAKVRKKE
jgi:hypothetical protein